MPVRPAPGGLPLVGHAPAYLRDRLGFFAGCVDGAGAVVRCRLTGAGYLLNDPEDVRHVLVRNQPNYVKSRRVAGPRAKYPAPHNLLTSAGAEHRRRRRALQPVFRRALADRLTERTRANAERLAASWADGTDGTDGGEVDVGRAMTALAQRNILETLFGTATDERLARLAAAAGARRRAFEGHFVSLFPAPEYVPTRANRDHLRATRLLGATVAEEIAGRRGSRERPDDLLSMLMDATYEDGATLTDRELRDEVLMISLTGYDSVSEALAWTLYLLAGDAVTDAAVAAEARSSPNGLPHLTGAVKESLRLFPPTWMFVRIARDDDSLPSGARIPAGAKVYLCPYVVHRNPRYWSEPERFVPGRFAASAAEEAGRPRYAYFPFGGGPHVCIGETLAMAQVVTALASIAARHRLTLVPGDEVVAQGGLTLKPKRLRMRIEPR